MKDNYRSATGNLLSIGVYENDGKTLVCNVDVKKTPSGFHRVNVHKVRS